MKNSNNANRSITRNIDLMSSSTTRLYRGCAATNETEQGDHDFCLSWLLLHDSRKMCQETVFRSLIVTKMLQALSKQICTLNGKTGRSSTKFGRI